MRGVRVDDQLLADAMANYEDTLDDLNDRAAAYADQFHKSVIVPFCNRHNLRFWSGNGTWFFQTPNGKNLQDPETAILDWAIASGNAEYKEDPRSVSGKSWVRVCEEIPEFLWNYAEIEKMLSLSFMGGCLGYWVGDHKPQVSLASADKNGEGRN